MIHESKSVGAMLLVYTSKYISILQQIFFLVCEISGSHNSALFLGQFSDWCGSLQRQAAPPQYGAAMYIAAAACTMQPAQCSRRNGAPHVHCGAANGKKELGIGGLSPMPGIVSPYSNLSIVNFF